MFGVKPPEGTASGAITDHKPTNPKDSIGSNKLPLHLVPPSAKAYCALGLLEGACKYGRANWRNAGVRASIYYDAAGRHLDAWFEGQTNDPKTHIPHLANAIACLAILIDATEARMLIDDRNIEGGYGETRDWVNEEVPRIKALFADHNPHHFTIADDVPEKVTGRAEPTMEVPEYMVNARPSLADKGAFRHIQGFLTQEEYERGMAQFLFPHLFPGET